MGDSFWMNIDGGVALVLGLGVMFVIPAVCWIIWRAIKGDFKGF